MKKNLFSVIILALVLVNLVLNVVMMFTIMPAMKSANNLITQVCSAIDLELESGDGSGASSVDVKNLSVVKIEEGNAMTINLKDSGDGEKHYAQVSVAISMDTQNEDYEEYGGDALTEKESLIKGQINAVISSHTIEEMIDNQGEVQEEILDALQEYYGSNFIVEVIFENIICE